MLSGGTDSNKVRESGSDGENIFEDKSESEIKVASQAKKNAAPGKHMKDHPSGRQASMNPSGQSLAELTFWRCSCPGAPWPQAHTVSVLQACSNNRPSSG